MTLDELIAKHPGLFCEHGWHNCPPGWMPLLAEFCERIANEYPESRIEQVKDKFGELRLYVSGSDEIFELAHEYERRSQTMCEECGAPSKRTNKGGWIVNRCEEHRP